LFYSFLTETIKGPTLSPVAYSTNKVTVVVSTKYIILWILMKGMQVFYK